MFTYYAYIMHMYKIKVGKNYKQKKKIIIKRKSNIIIIVDKNGNINNIIRGNKK